MNQKKNVITDIYCRVKVKSSMLPRTEMQWLWDNWDKQSWKKKVNTQKGGIQILFLHSTAPRRNVPNITNNHKLMLIQN